MNEMVEKQNAETKNEKGKEAKESYVIKLNSRLDIENDKGVLRVEINEATKELLKPFLCWNDVLETTNIFTDEERDTNNRSINATPVSIKRYLIKTLLRNKIQNCDGNANTRFLNILASEDLQKNGFIEIATNNAQQLSDVLHYTNPANIIKNIIELSHEINKPVVKNYVVGFEKDGKAVNQKKATKFELLNTNERSVSDDEQDNEDNGEDE
jgi:hypothetical protein